MLLEQEKQEIEEELKKFPLKSAACIEALKIVQKHRKWVPDESIEDLAEILDMTAAEVENVATFYNLVFRRPVGRHVILLCDSISCWIMKYEKIKESLHERLGIDFGETTKDDRFTLLPVQCLGNCDRAPSMMVDNDLYDTLTPEKLDEILSKYE
ncbi:MAG TPA: NADH-quinone oxidoreductase subunit NuoE [Bacteroidales bacterium]|nr:NADH-quinone oxidoreductase subunit NuoE [Bacteroidales bacterium]